MSAESGRADGRVAAVIQARMGSARLPGKVLAEIGGRPALSLLIARLRGAGELAEIALATSDDAGDDAVAALGDSEGIRVIRGPLDDVLERYRLAVEALGCDAVARVTGDCPLIDPAVVDLVVGRWRAGDEDYVANTIPPRSFPDGLDTEVVSRGALEAAAAEAREAAEREHVTPFVIARPQRFAQAAVRTDPPYGQVRITLDTEQDLAVLRDVVDRAGPDAGMAEILAALGAQPDR